MSELQQNTPLQDAISLRGADLQIDALSRHGVPWATKRLVLFAQVFAWMLALGSCALPVVLAMWVQKPVTPYGVTTTGHVSSLVVVEEEKVLELLSSGRGGDKSSPDTFK